MNPKGKFDEMNKKTSWKKYDYIFLCQPFSPRNIGYMLDHMSMLASELSKLKYRVAMAIIKEGDIEFYRALKLKPRKKLQMILHLTYDFIFMNTIGIRFFIPALKKILNGSKILLPAGVDLIFSPKFLAKSERLVVNGMKMANYAIRKDWIKIAKDAYYIIYHQYEMESREVMELAHNTFQSTFKKIYTSDLIVEKFSGDSRAKITPAISIEGNCENMKPVRKLRHSVLIPLRSSWIKGADTAIQVIARLHFLRPDIRITTFGDLPKDLWSSYSINKGIVSESELVSLYCENEIFVVTSRIDGISGPAVESMKYGCAVISTNVSGAREIVSHDFNGLIVETEDVDGLVKAIIKLTDNPTLIEEFASRSSEVIARFSSMNMAKTFLNAVNFYESES